MAADDERLRSGDADLYLYRWTPVAGPRAIVQVVHGMCEHAGRYARLAEYLNAAGFAVIAHDQRGHGLTAAAGQLGFVAEAAGWRLLVDDVQAVRARAGELWPRIPHFLLGHSMGSFVVQDYLARAAAGLAGAILTGSNGKPSPLARAGALLAKGERLRVGARGTSALLQKLGFDGMNKGIKPARTAFDWLSRDAAEVDKYLADRLCGFPVSVQFWIDLLEALDAVAAPGAVNAVPKDLPVLLMSGDRDPVGDHGDGVKRLAAAYAVAGLHRVETKLYPGARHEVFNETNRVEVLDDLVAWCDRVLAAR